MASHKRAGAGVSITTKLPAQRVAEICKQAADQTEGRKVLGVSQHIRLEDADTGRLSFSIRTMNDRLEQMVFAVTLAQNNGHQQVSTKITRFKTKQQKALHFIPMGRKRMMGLNTYESFVAQFEALVHAADPQAQAVRR